MLLLSCDLWCHLRHFTAAHNSSPVAPHGIIKSTLDAHFRISQEVGTFFPTGNVNSDILLFSHTVFNLLYIREVKIQPLRGLSMQWSGVSNGVGRIWLLWFCRSVQSFCHNCPCSLAVCE